METSDFDLFDEDVTEQFKFQLHFLEYTGIPANAENFAKFIKTQVNLVDLDFRLDICSEELLLVLNAMPPTVKRLGFEAKQYEGEVAEGILHYTNNHVESLNIMYIWILCGTNKWTLDMMEKFVGRFTALKFLNLHLNKCSENLMDLTFAEMKNLETVEVELWNDEVMLPHLNIPKLKYLRTVNTERSLSSWKIAMEKNPSIEKIRIDDRAKINLVKLILSECQSLQTLIISGYISPQTKAILKEEFPERYHMIKF